MVGSLFLWSSEAYIKEHIMLETHTTKPNQTHMHNIFSMGPQGLFWSLSNANVWAPVQNDLDERSRENSGDVDQNKAAGLIAEAARKQTQTHLSYKTAIHKRGSVG